ncbi:hypothetical protein [Microseira wollei]|uniref:Uncharacterized protein n=1 Tax=Microseira wollei NIES-4236 TaxID=2530354 RepID=A0AAV3WN09_9CYAN|nr:hypothetical protein [Microseira wollei]GET38190.1 hypothetical protein MiSe_29440 [Microseira wollei NIES-4236]GET43014.1 hypothetical protein MiSe_78340 [Microseira wollei NIES-4236]
MTNRNRKNPKNQDLFPFYDIVYTDAVKAEIQQRVLRNHRLMADWNMQISPLGPR